MTACYEVLSIKSTIFPAGGPPVRGGGKKQIKIPTPVLCSCSLKEFFFKFYSCLWRRQHPAASFTRSSGRKNLIWQSFFPWPTFFREKYCVFVLVCWQTHVLYVTVRSADTSSWVCLLSVWFSVKNASKRATHTKLKTTLKILLILLDPNKNQPLYKNNPKKS